MAALQKAWRLCSGGRERSFVDSLRESCRHLWTTFLRFRYVCSMDAARENSGRVGGQATTGKNKNNTLNTKLVLGGDQG